MVGAGTQGSAGRPYTPPTLSDSGSQAALPHLMPSGLRRLRHFAAKALEKNQVAAADDVIAAIEYLESTAGPCIAGAGVEFAALKRKARTDLLSAETSISEIPIDGHLSVPSSLPADVAHASPVLRVELPGEEAHTSPPGGIASTVSASNKMQMDRSRPSSRAYVSPADQGVVRRLDGGQDGEEAGEGGGTTSAERISSILASQQVLVNRELDEERRVHFDLTSGMVDLVSELKQTTLDMNRMVRTQNMQLDEIKEHATTNLVELEKQKKNLKQQLQSSAVGFWTSLYMYILVLAAFVATYAVIRIFPSNRL